MNTLTKLAISGALFTASALADNHTEDTAALRGLIGSYQTALNSSDVQQVMALYSTQPTFMPQHAPAQVGREAVQQAYTNVFNSIDLDISFQTHELEVLGETAWARTSSAGSTRILANDMVVTEGNNELFIFKKEEGNWKIYQYLFATNQPRQ